MESNLFVINNSLVKEIDVLKKDFDKQLNSTKLENENKIKLYEEKIKLYEEKIKLYEDKDNERKNIKKNYCKNYFQEKTKNLTKHCSICSLDIKSSSYCNHIKSKYHLEKCDKKKEEE